MTPELHEPGCPSNTPHSDAARACRDAVNLHVAALGWDAVKRWVAVRLSDGRSDGVLYDTKADAIRHQLDEQLAAYVCIPPNGMDLCGAENFLEFHRRSYGAGFRLIDPGSRTGGPEILRRLTGRDQSAQSARLAALARR